MLHLEPSVFLLDVVFLRDVFVFDAKPSQAEAVARDGGMIDWSSGSADHPHIDRSIYGRLLAGGVTPFNRRYTASCP